MSEEFFTLESEYITLGQFLKITDFIQSGGQARFFLENNEILINGEPENRRGKKLYPQDKIQIGERTFIIK